MNVRSEDSDELPQGGATWVYASAVVTTAAGALFYLYLARAVSLDQLGAIVVLQAFAYIVATAASLGLGRGFQHFLAFFRGRGEGSTYTRPLVGMSYVTVVLLCLASAGISLSIAGGLSLWLFHSANYLPTIELLAPYAGLLVATIILTGVIVGLQRYIAYSVVMILGTATMYGVPVVLYSEYHSLQSIVLGWIAGAVVLISAALVVIERITRLPSGTGRPAAGVYGRLYRNLFTYSLPVVVSALVTTCTYYIDRLILASLVNLPTVGIYNYAILFASASLFAVSPFQTILISRISALFGRGESGPIASLVRTGGTLVVLIFVPLSLALSALGPVLLRYLVGAPFVAAALPMAVLLGISAAFVPFTILTSLASGIRRTSAVMVSSVCALAANASLSILLVPHFGMVGAAIGNSSMFWAPFLALYLLFRETGLVDFDLRSMAAVWAASVGMALTVAVPLLLLGYALPFVPLFAAAGVVVFVILVRGLGALPWEVTVELQRHLPTWANILRPIIRWAGEPGRPRPEPATPPLAAPLAPEQR